MTPVKIGGKPTFLVASIGINHNGCRAPLNIWTGELIRRDDGDSGEAGPEWSWSAASVDRRAEAGRPAGVADRRAPRGGLSEIRGERRPDVPLEAESRPRAQGVRRDGLEEPRARAAEAGRGIGAGAGAEGVGGGGVKKTFELKGLKLPEGT